MTVSFPLIKRLFSFLFSVSALLLMFGSSILNYPEVDVQDEAIYLDHLIKASQLRLGQAGDLYSRESVQEICWRGGQSDHPSVPTDYQAKCLSDDPVAAFGVNYSTPMPLYYLVTGVTARFTSNILDLIGFENTSIVTIARFLGVGWFLLAAIFVRKSIELFIPRARLALPLTLGCAALPSLFHEYTIVNADASSFALGATVIYFSLRFALLKTSMWSTLISAGFALLATSHNLVGVTTSLMFVLLAGFNPVETKNRAWSFGPRRSVFLVGGLVIISASLTQLWNHFIIGLVRPWIYGKPDTDPSSIGKDLQSMYASDGLRWFSIFSPENLTRFVFPSSDNFQPIQRFGGPYNSVVWFFGLLLIAGLLASLLSSHRYQHLRLLSIAHVSSALIFPVLFVLQWNFQGVHDLVVARFALSTLAVPIITSAVIFDERKSSRILIWLMSFAAISVGILTSFVDWV